MAELRERTYVCAYVRTPFTMATSHIEYDVRTYLVRHGTISE